MSLAKTLVITFIFLELDSNEKIHNQGKIMSLEFFIEYQCYKFEVS